MCGIECDRYCTRVRVVRGGAAVPGLGYPVFNVDGGKVARSAWLARDSERCNSATHSTFNPSIGGCPIVWLVHDFQRCLSRYTGYPKPGSEDSKTFQQIS